MYKKSRSAIRDLSSRRPHLGADEIDLERGFRFGDSSWPGRCSLGFAYPTAVMSDEHMLPPGELRQYRDRRRALKRAF